MRNFPEGRLRSARLVGVGVASAAAIGSLVVAAGPAQANFPPKPGEVRVASTLSEPVPAGCPSSAPAGMVRVPGDVGQLCRTAVAGATSPQAAGAIRYAFAHLGAAYSQFNRDSVSPPVYDCSSLVGRAFRAAGARITRGSSSWNFYPYFGWTGAYTTDAYQGTNLMRLASNAPMVPGDIIIQFNGSNPANSAGNAGHAQMYLGTIGGSRLVIHSSGGGLKVVKYGNGWFSNEWHFRYKSLTTPLTAADRVDSQVTPWKYETYTAPANTVLHKRLQVTPEDGRVVYLQRFLPYWKRWINYSQSATGDSGIVPFDIPMFK